jgi:hypothetical protein
LYETFVTAPSPTTAPTVLDVAVEAVVGDVQCAVFEPFEKRRFAVVEPLCERLLPTDELARQARPIAVVIEQGFGNELVVGCGPGDVRRLH